MNLSTVFPGASPKALRKTAVLALILALAAHGFCFFNLTYSGESVMLNAAKGSASQIASGAFLMPLYWRVRGAISAPLWVGLLSSCYLSLTVVLLCGLFGLASPYLIAMLAVRSCFRRPRSPSLPGRFTPPTQRFSAFLLASCAAVFCLRVRAGTLLGALLLAAAQALDRSSLSFFLGVSAICLIQSLLKADESARTLVGRVLRILLCAALGMAVYLGGFMLFLHRAGLDREAALQAPAGKTVVGAWLYPLALLFKPLTIYAHVGVVLHALLIALGAFALLRLLPKMKGRVPALALLLLVFPLLVNLPAYSTLSAEQTSMSYVLLDALLIVLLQAAFESSVDERHLAYRAGTVMLGVSLLGTTIFANQVYLKKTLEFDSTLSVMTRVIARAEAVPAFKPGETPVALVGSIEDSELSVVHEGFEKLDALDAAANNFAATDDTGNIWYTWEVLGYPFSLVDAYTLGQLEQRDDVQAMPAFPAQDCCQMIDGTLVVKLSAI